MYFLLIPGWEDELRGNRWHFAVRWAELKPVVLVSPVLSRGDAVSVAEPRIPNCRILRTQIVGEPNQLAKVQIQVGQVLADMVEHRFSAPLLWCYNPDLAELYAKVPALVRVHHASENYFDMPDRGPAYHQHVRAVVATSDLTVAVSDGVSAGIVRRVDGADVVTVGNGCDFVHYSAGKPDEALVQAGRSFARVAVYAGNINGRVDFDLLHRVAAGNPQDLFAVYGPVKDLRPSEIALWQKVVNLKNVIAPGAVDPDRLPNLYAAADVGLIPYRQDPWLVENGLPLKALEMCATGLPVVSSRMKPLSGLAESLVVTSSTSDFLSAYSRTSRASLSPSQSAQLKAVSAANDYDTKFETILDALDQRVTRSTPVTRVDKLIEVLGPEWVQAEIRYSRWLAMPSAARGAGRLVGSLALLLPAGMRRRLATGRLRAAMRQLLGS
ncbi:MAG TPA: glycosyltransferase [Candidatus Acidoferrum sp.]|nr:glycosyltransferase [Candidatus Acidoferrum sp.]